MLNDPGYLLVSEDGSTTGAARLLISMSGRLGHLPQADLPAGSGSDWSGGTGHRPDPPRPRHLPTARVGRSCPCSHHNTNTMKVDKAYRRPLGWQPSPFTDMKLSDAVLAAAMGCSDVEGNGYGVGADCHIYDAFNQDNDVGSRMGPYRLPLVGQFPMSDVRDPPTPMDPLTTAFYRWRTECSWFRFPAEIRNKMYQWLVKLPDSVELYSSFYRNVGRRDRRYSRALPSSSEHVRISTPTILLLCRAITRECLPILKAQTFRVDRIPPWPPGRLRPLMVTNFIGQHALQSLQNIEVCVDLGRGEMSSGWIWHEILTDLLNPLAQCNSLMKLRVLIKMFQLKNSAIWEIERPKYVQVRDKIDWFAQTRRQFWRHVEVEVVHWEVGYEGVYKVQVNRSGLRDMAMFQNVRGFVERGTRVGDYPDPDLIPGSITEFLSDPMPEWGDS